MVFGIHLSLRLSGGHLPEPASHGKAALAGGVAQREILFGSSFRQSDEWVQGAFLFEEGEGGVGVNESFLSMQKAFLEWALAVQQKGVLVFIPLQENLTKVEMEPAFLSKLHSLALVKNKKV